MPSWLGKLAANSEGEVFLFHRTITTVPEVKPKFIQIVNNARQAFTKVTPILPRCYVSEGGGLRWGLMAASNLVFFKLGYLDEVENVILNSASSMSGTAIFTQDLSQAGEKLEKMMSVLSDPTYVNLKNLMVKIARNTPYLGGFARAMLKDGPVIDNAAIVDHLIREKMIVLEKLKDVKPRIWISYFNMDTSTTEYALINDKSPATARDLLIGSTKILSLGSQQGSLEGQQIIDSVFDPIGIDKAKEFDPELEKTLVVRSHHVGYRCKPLGILANLVFGKKYVELFQNKLNDMHTTYNRAADELYNRAIQGRINMTTPSRSWESWIKTFDNRLVSQMLFSKLGVKTTLQLLEQNNWFHYLEWKKNSLLRKILGNLEPVDVRREIPDWAFGS